MESSGSQDNIWKACNSCKKSILLSGEYYVCSVSTCNGKRTGLNFCSVHCFERHLPGARHKDAAAIEMRAPKTKEPASLATKSVGQRRVVSSSNKLSTSNIQSPSSNEILVVASRLKSFIDQRSGGYNTSSSVMNVLSHHIRLVCDQAIESAKADGRKTIMDRDFSFLKK